MDNNFDSQDLITKKQVVDLINELIPKKDTYIEHNAQIEIMHKVLDLTPAYDVDKVEEQLGEYSTSEMIRTVAGKRPIKVVSLNDAVEIVKGGVVE